jgi:hypothetical protein
MLFRCAQDDLDPLEPTFLFYFYFAGVEQNKKADKGV